MLRQIVGFHTDAEQDWVAELSCFHNQHVRHRPPFQERPWVTKASARARRIGSELDCPLCDRAELPANVIVARTAGPFDAASLPPALRKIHRVPDGKWGVLRVIDGCLGFIMTTDPPIAIRLCAGDTQAIPPSIDHKLTIDRPVMLAIDFLVPDQGALARRSPA